MKKNKKKQQLWKWKKKKSSGNEKKSSENDKSTGHFQSFFLCPTDPKSEFFPVNQL